MENTDPALRIIPLSIPAALPPTAQNWVPGPRHQLNQSSPGRDGDLPPREGKDQPRSARPWCSAISSLGPSDVNNGQVIFPTLFYPAPAGAASQVAGILYNPPKDQQMIFLLFPFDSREGEGSRLNSN